MLPLLAYLLTTEKRIRGGDRKKNVLVSGFCLLCFSPWIARRLSVSCDYQDRPEEMYITREFRESQLLSGGSPDAQRHQASYKLAAAAGGEDDSGPGGWWRRRCRGRITFKK